MESWSFVTLDLLVLSLQILKSSHPLRVHHFTWLLNSLRNNLTTTLSICGHSELYCTNSLLDSLLSTLILFINSLISSSKILLSTLIIWLPISRISYRDFSTKILTRDRNGLVSSLIPSSQNRRQKNLSVENVSRNTNNGQDSKRLEYFLRKKADFLFIFISRLRMRKKMHFHSNSSRSPRLLLHWLPY